MAAIKMLGVLLCYNDGDMLEDSIRWLRQQNHDVIAWDHGSTDQTADILTRYRMEFVETRRIPREFDFYELYPAMSHHLLEKYVSAYDWISWPDQDEILEGPSRARPYCKWLEEVHASDYNWIQFNNLNFWLTNADAPTVVSPVSRVRHYALFPDCAPRIRSWRAAATNVRVFNHNPPIGEPWPARFNLRHYSMRTREQMLARVFRDRADLRRGDANYHYENMRLRLENLEIPAEQLHYDDGRSELNLNPIFNWRSVYGYAAPPSQPG